MAYTYKHGDRPLDGLTIQRAVGRGGFGEVYYALTDSGKQVAVKYLRDNPEVELRGIAHVMNLKSPHLITIYDVRKNEHEDPFVIMEYVSGPSLRELLNAEPDGLGPQKAGFFLNGICKGLSYLHERGIVHRDLKPGNIFYDDGYVKIGDYGLSKHIAVSAHSGNTVSVGTVHYMAPEIGSGSYTKAIDIYALGVMLYEMLTGRLPFRGSSMGEILMKHLSDRPELGGIDEPFRSVIRKALEKNPADRYQDVNEMVDALMSAGGLQESVSTFDPSVLTAVPRDAEAGDVERTRTTPPPPGAPRPPLTLDARDVQGGALPPIPPIPKTPPARPKWGGPWLTGRFGQRGERAHRFGEQLKQEVNAQAEELLRRAAPIARARWPQLLTAGILLMALCAGVGIIFGDGGIFGAMILYIVGGTLAPLIAYAIIRKRGQDLGALDRALYAASGFILMLPAFAAAREGAGGADGRALSMMIVPLSVGLALHSWTERVQNARRARIEGGSAFWHGITAMIIGAMVNMGELTWVAGITGASLVLAVQAIAQLWPMRAPQGAPTAAAPPGGSGAPRYWGDEIQKTVDSIEKWAAAAPGQRSPKLETPPPPPPAAPGGAAAAIYIDADQPSFVGRAANAGLSLLAKLLLIGGLVVAFAYYSDGFAVDGRQAFVGLDNQHLKVRFGNHTLANEPIPRAVPFAMIGIGTLGLTLARMGTSVPHFLRGIGAGALALMAVVFALGPAASGMTELVRGDVDDAFRNGKVWVVLWTGAASLVLLMWRFRRKKTIRV